MLHRHALAQCCFQLCTTWLFAGHDMALGLEDEPFSLDAAALGLEDGASLVDGVGFPFNSDATAFRLGDVAMALVISASPMPKHTSSSSVACNGALHLHSSPRGESSSAAGGRRTSFKPPSQVMALTLNNGRIGESRSAPPPSTSKPEKQKKNVWSEGPSHCCPRHDPS